MKKAVIEHIVSYLPERRMDNEDLVAQIKCWTADEIYRKTGFLQRHIANPEECASDLAFRAAKKLFQRQKGLAEEVDFLLFCTQSPDYFLPTTACLLQERLGLGRHCGALDFNLGCSGYVYGLSLAKGLIESGQAKCVLLLTGETYSKFIHPLDRSVCTLFGDGATATIVRMVEHAAAGIGEFIFGTDGRGGGNLIVPAGGARKPRSEATAVETVDEDGNVRSQDNLYMNGREVFRFAIQTVPEAINRLLIKSGLCQDDVDWLVLHQATRYMLDELLRKTRWPRTKVPYEFEDVGNTVSSTIPIVLERLIAQGRLQTGHRVFLVGFGVGYSWGGCLVQWR